MVVPVKKDSIAPVVRNVQSARNTVRAAKTTQVVSLAPKSIATAASDVDAHLGTHDRTRTASSILVLNVWTNAEDVMRTRAAPNAYRVTENPKITVHASKATMRTVLEIARVYFLLEIYMYLFFLFKISHNLYIFLIRVWCQVCVLLRKRNKLHPVCRKQQGPTSMQLYRQCDRSWKLLCHMLL